MLVLGVFTAALTARFLLPEGRGALAAVLFWPQLIAGVGLLSLNEAATYSIGSQPERASKITASCVWLALLLAGVAMIAGYALLSFLLGEEREHLLFLARVYLFYIPFNFLALSLLGVDQGKLRFTRYNAFRLMVPLIYLSGLLVLWATDQVAVAWVVGVNLLGTLVATLTRLGLHGRRLLVLPSWQEARILLRIAVRFHPATLLLLLAAQADLFVVLTLWDDATLGVYVVALSLASTGLIVVSGTVHRVLFPQLAHLSDPAAQAAFLTRAVRYSTVLVVGLAIPVALTLPWLVRILFGPAFGGAVPVAFLLLLVFPAVALKTILIQCLRGMGEGRPGTIAAAISLGAILILAWPLGMMIGLPGVPIALGLANVAGLAFIAYHLRWQHAVTLRDLWGLTPSTVGEVYRSAARAIPFFARTAG